MTSRLLPALAVALLAAAGAVLSTAAAPLTLGTAGERFTVNGTPRFLVLTSYFDALDAAALDDDLAMLARSVDGVRIFANWWDVRDDGDCRNKFSPGGVIERADDGGARVRPAGLDRLRHVLRRARAHGLIVDLTFAADTVRGASELREDERGRVCPPAGFKNAVDWVGIAAAVGEVARALAADEFDHVFFDLQNEAGHDWNRATDDDLAKLVEAVRAEAPKRLISVSSYDPDADRQAARVRALKLSMLNYHDVPRGKGWGGRTAGHVRRFRQALERVGVVVPVYAGEPDPNGHGRGTREFETAVTGARSAGAGAWTLHHRGAYRLDDRALARQLDPVSRQVLAALPGWLGR
jgi:hypothetical protein